MWTRKQTRHKRKHIVDISSISTRDAVGEGVMCVNTDYSYYRHTLLWIILMSSHVFRSSRGQGGISQIGVFDCNKLKSFTHYSECLSMSTVGSTPSAPIEGRINCLFFVTLSGQWIWWFSLKNGLWFADIPQSTIITTVTPTPILVKATSSLTNEGKFQGNDWAWHAAEVVLVDDPEPSYRVLISDLSR